MAKWRLTTVEKKNAVEREHWIHTEKNHVVVYETGFRWGSVFVFTDDDNPPDIDLENADGLDVYSLDCETELDLLDDGCWSDWEFPDEMSKEDRDALQEGWEEDSYDYMENAGWYSDETELWFNGPLELERVED
jgi:hypothetical protein